MFFWLQPTVTVCLAQLLVEKGFFNLLGLSPQAHFSPNSDDTVGVLTDYGKHANRVIEVDLRSLATNRGEVWRGGGPVCAGSLTDLVFWGCKSSSKRGSIF